LPKSEQGYVFVLEDTETGAVAGICAIEVAVGLNDPWYNYRVGTMVHASKELNVYNALPTLFLCNDHTGASELCTLFLDPAWRKEWQRLFTLQVALYVYGGVPRPLQRKSGC
jgi:arginine N-succinyltransferase